MTYDPVLYQHVRANNDVNGNPRRAFIVYAADGTVLDVIDEGYAGPPAWLRELHQLPTFSVTVTEYKNWLRHKADR